MSRSTFFVQECPTCGRRLHIRVEHLGRTVVCQHCCGRFVASDPTSVRRTTPELADSLMRRADELLQNAGQELVPSRASRPR